jgi:hypothetical protein
MRSGRFRRTTVTDLATDLAAAAAPGAADGEVT